MLKLEKKNCTIVLLIYFSFEIQINKCYIEWYMLMVLDVIIYMIFQIIYGIYACYCF